MLEIVKGQIPFRQELTCWEFAVGREPGADLVPFVSGGDVDGLCLLCKVPPTAPPMIAATRTTARRMKRIIRKFCFSQLVSCPVGITTSACLSTLWTVGGFGSTTSRPDSIGTSIVVQRNGCGMESIVEVNVSFVRSERV